MDSTEQIRREEVEEINKDPGSRESLESSYGQVWDTTELSREFNVLGFMAPYVVVERKKDNVRGSMQFQHMPRFYFNFKEE